MSGLRQVFLAVVLPLLAVGCSNSGVHDPVLPSGGGTGPGVDAGLPAPTFSDEDWLLLRTLAPSALPPAAPDVSNSFADNEIAAKFGQTLFFDSSFSGKLLDADNDGGPNSLGMRGQSAKVSCAGCHVSKSGFVDTRSTFQEISLGAGWTHRRTPSLLDVGQAKIVMWGGRYPTLWSQPFGPFENPLEMNSSRLFVAELAATRYSKEYEAIFGAGSLGDLATSSRFPKLSTDSTGCKLTREEPRPRAVPPDPLYECHGIPGDGAEFDGLDVADQDLVNRTVANLGKALAAYERKLTCGAGRFDAWVNGDNGAFSASEQRGVAVFIGNGKCVSCHSGAYLSDQKFHNVGLKIVPTKEGIYNGSDRGALVDLAAAKGDPVGISGPYSDGDDGRLPASVDAQYDGAFRTPTLRCVNQRPSFMHTGTVHALETVVGFFSSGGDSDGFSGTSELKPVNLSLQELRDLVAFLKALDGPGAPAELTAAPTE